MRSNERFEKAENYLILHRSKIVIGLCLITALFSTLLFNLRMSEGADDSSYIYGGYKYAHDFFNYCYTNNAPLYPMLLSIPIKLFGINILLLKLTSFILYFFSFLFFLKAFEKRIPYLVLIPCLIFYAICPQLQYYSSQTYNEASFLFFQSLFLFLFFKLLDKIKEDNGFSSLKNNFRSWFFIGLLVTFISLVKNLGVVVIPLVILFFLLRKEWKLSIISAFVLLGARSTFELFKVFFLQSSSQFAAQSKTLLYRDPYSPEKGMQNASDLVSRFFGNCNLYFSRRIPQVLGLQSSSTSEIYAHSTTVTISIIIAILLLFSFLMVIKSRDRILFFSCIYTGGLMVASFIVLHVNWGQARFIIIHMPILLLVFYFALHRAFSKLPRGFIFYLTSLIILNVFILFSSFKAISKNIPVLIENAKGNKYYGYTPDWQHFLKMSSWCADNLPSDAGIASRKASMSFIYGKGREFFPINRVLFPMPGTDVSNPDSVLNYFKANKIQYAILGSLRYDPERNDGVTINTMTLILDQIVEKYPDKIKFIHREGEEEDEPCYLYEIKY